MKPGDKGDDVRELQTALQAAADPLPRYGSDGHFGSETTAAVGGYCEDQGIPYDGGEVPNEALVRLGLADPDPGDVRVYDLRGEATDPHPKSRTSGGLTIRRDPSRIVGVVLHQTAVEFGYPSKDPTDAGLARRSLTVACHAMAFDGFCTLAAPSSWHIYHADGLNSTTVGLEVDGNYPGLIGWDVSNSHEITELTERRIDSARQAMRLLVESARADGCPIEFIYAHRQSDSWRRADPGEELWRRVVTDYAVPVLGLKTEPARSWPDPQGVESRHGKPIPQSWDVEGVGRY